MKRLAIVAAAIVATLPSAAAAAAPATTHARTPSRQAVPIGPCNEDHILDIEIIDGVLFECTCEQRIFTANDCGWQEITSQADDPVRFRRIVRRARVQGRLVVAVAWVA